MRSFSFLTILFLCLALLVVDTLAFYWLQSITQFIVSPFIHTGINIAFWVFTIGLISSIIILKLRLNQINLRLKQQLISYLYGLAISSFIPKLIFVVIISTLYFTNYLFSEKQSMIIVPLAGLLSGFLPFFVILYGIFITIYRFKIRAVKIEITKLPPSLAGLKIIQISDLHLGSFNFQFHILERAVKMINALQADYIFFTGDMVNNRAWELKGWDKVLKKLTSKRGKYAILGNHDYGDYSKWKSQRAKKANFELIKYFHEKAGFKLLLNEAVVEEINGDKFAILGVENWGEPPFKQYGDLRKALNEANSIPFKILLSHNPSHWRAEVVQKTDISLTLSGHTHGMQAGIQTKKINWSPIKYKYEHWAGLYQIDDQYLYVNRGLGWLGFPGRLGMRPEITLIELEK